MSFLYLITVGLGGFLGATSRYYIAQKLNSSVDKQVPIGTLLVNLLGSFSLGILAGTSLNGLYMLLLGTGFLGAFTTFSTLNKELYILRKFPGKWTLYLLLTFLGGLLFVFSGYIIGSKVM